MNHNAKDFSRRELLGCVGLPTAAAALASFMGAPKLAVADHAHHMFQARWKSAGFSAQEFSLRGYYMILSRTQGWGLQDWKMFVDCMVEDGGNFLILWMAGGFPSRKFPETWQYNKANRNNQDNFSAKLIDYAHDHGIKVLLGFTPFAYDGVNQYSLAHPELAGKDREGRMVEIQGIHSLGRLLCAAQPGSHAFLLEYIREMYFDFHPNADGLFFEHSDYGTCSCPKCQENFIGYEWDLIQKVSEEIWVKDPHARMMIYPQYFQRRVAEPDTRFTLFFTPHSASITPEVLANDCEKVLWQMAFGESLEALRTQAKKSREEQFDGFVVSMEAFDCELPIDGRLMAHKPYDLPWKNPEVFPLNDIVPRVLRATYTACLANPLMNDDEFVSRIAAQFFGGRSEKQSAEDLLALFGMVQTGMRGFVRRNSLVHPEDLDRNSLGERQASVEADVTVRLKQLQHIAERHHGDHQTSREIAHVCHWILKRWAAVHPDLLPVKY